MPWLLIAVFGTFLGNSLNFVATSWLVLNSPAGVAGLGIIALTQFLPYLLWGYLSSYLSRSSHTVGVTIVTDLARGGVVFTGFLFVLIGVRVQLTLWVMVFLLNSLSAIFLPCYFATIGLRFKNETRSIVKFNSYSTVLIQLGDILGSILAAGLLLWVHAQYLLLLDSLTYFLSGTLLILGFQGIKSAQETTSEASQGTSPQLFGKLHWWKPSLFSVTFMGSTVATVVLLFNTLAPIKANVVLHNSSLFASMNAMYALGSACAGFLIGKTVRDRARMKAVLPLGGLIVLLFPLFLFLNQALWLLGLCLCIGLINGGWGSVMRSIPLVIFPAQEVGVVTNQRVIIETIIALGVSCALIAFPRTIESLDGIVIVFTALLLVALVISPLLKVQSLLIKEEKEV